MTQLIPYGSIVVPENRQRQEIGAAQLAELVESIRIHGLFHSIVVRELPDGSYQLVIGERRYQAIGVLIAAGIPFVHDDMQMEGDDCPVTLMSELDPIRLAEAEFEENIKRVDLTWQERSASLARLHEMRLGQNPKQGVAATAREVAAATGVTTDSAEAEVHRSRLVADFLADPQVKKARSLKEAHNIVTRKLENDFKDDLRKMQKAVTEHTFYAGDCLPMLQGFSDETFDCILTDPPYGMGADAFGTAGAAHTYTDGFDEAMLVCSSILLAGFSICKPQAHLYMFCDIDRFHDLRQMAADAGWYAWRTPLTWFKGGATGHDPLPQRGFRRTTEWLLYCIKGDKPHQKFMGDMLSVPTVANPLHPAAKPVELFRQLIDRSCLPGAQVLDPCCGTGTIFPAASACKVRATGIELSPEFAKIALNRMYEKE